MHIRETRTYEIDLGQRGVHYRSTADQFMSAYNRLLANNRLRAGDVMVFNQAADDLGGICPRWLDFSECVKGMSIASMVSTIRGDRGRATNE